MQDGKDTGHEELMRFIRWTVNNHYRWEDLTGFTETDSEELLSTLKSLYDNELHAMFLIALKKNGHIRTLNKILKNVIWEIVADAITREMVIDMENKVIQGLEQAQNELNENCNHYE